LERRNFSGNLREHVEDAKTRMGADEVFTPGEDSEDPDHPMGGMDGGSSPAKPPPTAARTPAVMRVPARTVVSPVPLPTIPRPASSKGQAAHSAFNLAKVPAVTGREEESLGLYDEMDIDLSPNTATSHNAPSLVSDDGEYDDSDDGSSSESSEGLDSKSVSDVAEINIEEDSEETPRPLIRHHRTNSATRVKLKKDEGTHVTFVTPITGNAKGRRKQNL
jgi:ADA HAT complex component 1